MVWPCETRTSTCRSFATISSGLYRFLAIAVLLDVKDIPQVGPLQWGWIMGVRPKRTRLARSHTPPQILREFNHPYLSRTLRPRKCTLPDGQLRPIITIGAERLWMSIGLGIFLSSLVFALILIYLIRPLRLI